MGELVPGTSSPQLSHWVLSSPPPWGRLQSGGVDVLHDAGQEVLGDAEGDPVAAGSLGGPQVCASAGPGKDGVVRRGGAGVGLSEKTVGELSPH